LEDFLRLFRVDQAKEPRRSHGLQELRDQVAVQEMDAVVLSGITIA
jgi:hypothetical protein